MKGNVGFNEILNGLWDKLSMGFWCFKIMIHCYGKFSVGLVKIRVLKRIYCWWTSDSPKQKNHEKLKNSLLIKMDEFKWTIGSNVIGFEPNDWLNLVWQNKILCSIC